MRFRHEDTDIVRAAASRTSCARQAADSASRLIDKRDRLVKIFGRNTSTDAALRSTSEVLRLLKLALFSATSPSARCASAGTLGPSFVESETQMSAMTDDFLNVQDTPGARGISGDKVGPRRKKLPAVGEIGLEDATGFGKDQAIQAVQAGAGTTLASIPALRLQGSVFAGPPRVYKLRGTDGKRYGAYWSCRRAWSASTTASRARTGRRRQSWRA